MNSYKRYLTPGNLFLGLSLLGILLFPLVMAGLGQHGMDWIVMENNSDFEAADYTLCLLYSMSGSKVYSFGPAACYSPLAYSFFRLICQISGVDIWMKDMDLLHMSYQEMIGMTGAILAMPYQALTYILYLLLGILLYLYAIDTLKIDASKKRLLSLVVIMSVPAMFGAVERGNLTLYVAGFCIIAYRWSDSDSPFKRESALLLIAFSSGLKFYPAVMGILYLREKRWKEAVRLIVYGVIFVFLPFAFYGGLDGIRGLLLNLSQLAVEEPYHYRIQFFKGFLSFFHIHKRIISVLNLGFIMGILLMICRSKSHLRRAVYLAAALALYAPNAYRYMLLFFLIPLLEWMEEESNRKTSGNYIYACLFCMIFSIPILFGILTGFQLNLGFYTLTLVEFVIYIGAWGLLGYSLIQELAGYLHMKKSNQ